jgi:hypothetical protein
VPEAGLVAEDQPAHVGVQPVGADDQVEAPRWAELEADLDPVAILVQGPDRVAEAVVDVVAGGLVEDGGELAAHDLHVPVRDPGDQPADVHLDGPAARALHHDQLGLGPGGLHLAQDPHPLGDVNRRAEQVDGMPAQSGPQGRGLLDDGWGEAIPVQPPGQGGPGHAGPGHQHLGVPQPHRPPPPGRRPVPEGVGVTLSYRHQT